jgi:hypothetical protein
MIFLFFYFEQAKKIKMLYAAFLKKIKKWNLNSLAKHLTFKSCLLQSKAANT